MQRYKSILLSKKKYKEYDELLLLYVEHVGVISAIIRGSLRRKNKYNGKIELFTTYYIEMNVQRNLSVVYGFERVESWVEAPEQLLPLYLNGSQINELIKKAVPERQAISGLFLIIESMYTFIINSETPELAVAFVEMKLAPYLGVDYTFTHCTLCGTTEQIAAFSFENGGIVCKDCMQFSAEDIIDNHKLKVLIAFHRLQLSDFISAKIAKADAVFLVLFWKEIFEHQLGIHLNSQK